MAELLILTAILAKFGNKLVSVMWHKHTSKDNPESDKTLLVS